MRIRGCNLQASLTPSSCRVPSWSRRCAASSAWVTPSRGTALPPARRTPAPCCCLASNPFACCGVTRRRGGCVWSVAGCAYSTHIPRIHHACTMHAYTMSMSMYAYTPCMHTLGAPLRCRGHQGGELRLPPLPRGAAACAATPRQAACPMRCGQPTGANGAGLAHGRGSAARRHARRRTRALCCRLGRPRVRRRRSRPQPAYLRRARALRLHLDLLPARALGHAAADGEQGGRTEAGGAARTAAADWAVVGEWLLSKRVWNKRVSFRVSSPHTNFRHGSALCGAANTAVSTGSDCGQPVQRCC